MAGGVYPPTVVRWGGLTPHVVVAPAPGLPPAIVVRWENALMSVRSGSRGKGRERDISRNKKNMQKEVVIINDAQRNDSIIR